MDSDKYTRWQTLWDAAEPLNKKTVPAIKFLKTLGIKEYFGSKELRYSDGLIYYLDGKHKSYPALICSYTDNFDNQTGICRIYLTKDGELARVKEPKVFWGPLKGSSIKFGKLTDTLNLTLDMETAIAVHQATGQTCWACLMPCNLCYGYQTVPSEVSKVNLWLNSGERHAGQTFINLNQREGLEFFSIYSKSWSTRIKERGLSNKTAEINSRPLLPSITKAILEKVEF